MFERAAAEMSPQRAWRGDPTRAISLLVGFVSVAGAGSCDATVSLFDPAPAGAAGGAGTSGAPPAACGTDADCAMPTARCHPLLGTCTECRLDADCPETRCSPESGRCVECLDSSDCEEGVPHCDPTLGRCVECTTSAHCSEEGSPICDTTRGQCAECVDDTRCAPPEPFCQPAEGECVACLTAAHCIDGATCSEGQCE